VFRIDAFGRSGVGVKNAVAWLSDEPMIYDKLTPMEYLHFVAGFWLRVAISPLWPTLQIFDRPDPRS
jgi:hypothetical protein